MLDRVLDRGRIVRAVGDLAPNAGLVWDWLAAVEVRLGARAASPKPHWRRRAQRSSRRCGSPCRAGATAWLNAFEHRVAGDLDERQAARNVNREAKPAAAD